MERIYARLQSGYFHLDKILSEPGNLFSNTPTQRTDWNIWMTFVVFQPIADRVDNAGLDRALERSKKFAVGNVVIQAVAQIVADVVNKLFARLMNPDRVPV